MDIFNRIPAISEDTLRYAFYPSSELADHASATTLAACIQTYAENLLPADFLWHRDAFEVKVVINPQSKSENKSYFIEGRMRVGDCVDDEWCAVWLLKEISAKWEVAISVSDSDGEFLLIEAADALPKWVKPTNSTNRVWIHNSRLHLVDISHVSSHSRKPPSRKQQQFPNGNLSDDEDTEEQEDFLAIDDALNLLRESSIDTFAPPAVEQAVWSRISEYPTASRQHVHATNAYTPLDVAKALSVNPSLVQKAVEAFYTRDGVQLRSAHRMSRFPPHTCVLSTIKMTRTAYAQLAGQKFYPPKIFGRWNEREDTREWRWRDVGMKIAVGMEILYQENKARDVNTSAEGMRSSAEAKKDALRRNTDYNTYIENLLTAGYFKGEMKGSQVWNQLEDKAADIFVTTRQEDSSTRPSFTTMVNAAISQVPEDFLPQITDEDSDDWLNIDAENFEELLNAQRTPRQADKEKDKQSDSNAMEVDETETGSTSTPAKRVVPDQASQLRDLASKVEEFIEGEGDVEGARFADEMFSDDEMEDDDNDSDSESNDGAENDPEARQVAMDNLVPKLDPSEYGKMPASFHNNSQRVASEKKNNLDHDTTKTSDPEQLSAQRNHDQEASSSSITRPIRQPILPRDKYDGVDSDDETDEEDDRRDDSESEEDKPQVVGDIDVDMGEEEDEFLEFSRQALGISDAQWQDILQERRTRGAFVPNIVPPPIELPTVEKPPTRNRKTAEAGDGASPIANPNLDSFEAVMKAMEAELHHSQPSRRSTVKKSTQDKDKGKDITSKEGGNGKIGKGKGKAVSFADDDDSDDGDIDIEAAMEAELKAALEKGDELDEDGLGSANVDYNLIKNFLESLKSQGGLAGPVSNLAGRLQPGWQLPGDR